MIALVWILTVVVVAAILAVVRMVRRRSRRNGTVLAAAPSVAGRTKTAGIIPWASTATSGNDAVMARSASVVGRATTDREQQSVRGKGVTRESHLPSASNPSSRTTS